MSLYASKHEFAAEFNRVAMLGRRGVTHLNDAKTASPRLWAELVGGQVVVVRPNRLSGVRWDWLEFRSQNGECNFRTFHGAVTNQLLALNQHETIDYCKVGNKATDEIMGRSQQLGRKIRRFVVIGFYSACATTVGLAVLTVVMLLHSPFGSGFWEGETESVDLSGNAARRRLHDQWPSQIDPSVVESVSYKSIWSNDSNPSSSWYRIKVTQDAAKLWTHHILASDMRQAKMGDHPNRIEIVHGSRIGSPTYMAETSDIPTWWLPPSSDFHSTKILSRSTYSAFDVSANILWIYQTTR